MRSAVIAAIVAALFSAASATAAFVVTSANIKNGTIQTVDISAKAKRALKGNRGPQGPAGATGPAGAQGPPGIQRLVRVEASKAIGIETVDSVVASCPSGMVAVSGGFSTDADGSILTSSSVATGWFVTISTHGAAFGGSFTASVSCSPNIATTAAATAKADVVRRVVRSTP